MTRGALRNLGDIRLVAAGLLLLQLVWVFAVPPFRGSDEFDHAYRAAAVADGQWAPSPEAATRGTGAWVDVPADLVEAAGPECSALGYTRPHDCVGSEVDGDTVRVASGAGRYHPLFYELVGAPAMPFEGATALYVMRLVSAVLCWCFFVLALVALRSWARTRWPYVALTVATTPVVVYSTMLPAPNGLEMTSAMALWCSLIGLAVRPDASKDARLLAVGAVSAGVLVTLRSFGPLWCVLILLTVLVAVRVSRPRLREILLASRGWAAALFVLVATVGSLAWIRAMGSLVVGVDDEAAELSALSKAGTTAGETVLWVLQSIAAFPLRNEHTHPAVYAFMLIVAGTLVVAALRLGDPRGRVGLVVAAAVALLVPAAVTFATLETYGPAWQGRYTLPYSIGVLLVAGALLDRRPPRVRTDVLAAGGLLLVVAQVTGPVLIALGERSTSPGVANGDWVLVPPAVLAVVAVVGAWLMWSGAALVHEGGRADDAVDPNRPVPGTTEEVPHDRSDRFGVGVGADR